MGYWAVADAYDEGMHDCRNCVYFEGRGGIWGVCGFTDSDTTADGSCGDWTDPEEDEEVDE